MSQEILLALFCTFFLIQLYYWVFYFAKAAFYKPKNELKQKPPVSIVVAAWNELDNLRKLIPALKSQAYPNFEIIIVNDRSDDGTYDYLRVLGETDPQVKVLTVESTPQRMSPKKFAITLGVRAAEHECILFTDADCLPSSNTWINEMASQYDSKTEIVLGFSDFTKYPGWLNKFIRFETSLTALSFFGFALNKNAYMGVGRNLSYKKSLFMINKGLPHMDILGGDDDLFVNKFATKTNTAVSISPDSKTISEPKTTFKSWYIQKKRHLSVGKLYSFKSKLSLATLFFSQLFLYIIAILLCFGTNYWEIGVSLFVIRLIIVKFVMYKFSKKVNTNQEWYLIILLEWMYLVYGLLLGIIGFSTKKVRWK